MTRESPDPMLTALSELEAPAPREARAALVRARCHAAMAAARQPKPPSGVAWWAIEHALPVAAALYGVTIVVEALRIIVSLG